MKQRASGYMALPSYDTSRGAAKKKWDSLPEVQRTFRLKYLETFGDDGPPVVMYNHVQAFLSTVDVNTNGMDRNGRAQECLDRWEQFVAFAQDHRSPSM